MVNKAKKQGTTYETNIVNRLNKNNNFKSQRFAEGGSKDLGDVQLFVEDEEYFIEAKSRQNLNVHQSLDKAIEKSGSENTVLFWKKLKKRDGNSRRSSDGMPEVVSMSYDLFIKLLNKSCPLNQEITITISLKILLNKYPIRIQAYQNY